MKGFSWITRGDDNIKFYVIQFNNGKIQVDISWLLLTKLLKKSEASTRSMLRKYNVSMTTTPYFMDKGDADKAIDFLNGVYLAVVMVEKSK